MLLNFLGSSTLEDGFKIVTHKCIPMYYVFCFSFYLFILYDVKTLSLLYLALTAR